MVSSKIHVYHANTQLNNHKPSPKYSKMMEILFKETLNLGFVMEIPW